MDIDLIPKEFMKTKTTEAPAKAEIKKAIKAGNEIPGAVLVEYRNIKVG